MHDIQRRDKLQRLRDHDHRNSLNVIVKSPNESLPVLSSSSIVEQELSCEDISTAPDLLKNHPNTEHTRRHKKVCICHL